MVFKSKIKWVALLVLVLSMASLALHLFLAKSSTVNLVQYRTMAALSHDFASLLGTQNVRNTRLWGAVKPLDGLHPYPGPRNNYPAPTEQNGFIYAKIYGGLPKIKSSICDLVTISRLLNATLVLPEIQESVNSKGISSKFKSFSYLFNEEQFIASLANDVIIVRSLPEDLKAARKRKELQTFRPKSSAAPKFYIEEILPVLQKAKVIGLIISEGGCLQSILPPVMSDYQRLRCRVGFHALKFRLEIQVLGRQMVERLRAWGHPFLAYHPGLQRDTLAYHGCAELFQDVHTELIQYRRAEMIKSKLIHDKLSVDSRIVKRNGSCPLMPEEVGVLLRAMGHSPKTIIYLAGSETFGGQRLLVPLRAMFANLVDKTSLCSNQELSDLVGPESPLPPDSFQYPPAKTEQQLKEEWKKAGPRPRPLPPPPGRPIYKHEKEGWYGWITETDTEPSPSPMNLRMQAHRLLWDALDYIVSVEADAFFPGFNNDDSGWPDFSSLVMGQRLYERASFRTYRPDRKVLVKLLNITRDNIYHLQHNWTRQVQEHLNKSLGEEGLIRQSLQSKPTSFLSHPLPECSCRISSSEVPDPVKDNDGRFLHGGEDECPVWMRNSLQRQAVPVELADAEEDKNDEYEFPEHEPLQVEQASNDSGGRNNEARRSDKDGEMDPND